MLYVVGATPLKSRIIRWFIKRNHLQFNLHSPARELIELRMEHADMDALIDRLALDVPLDELMLRRMKKRRLALRDRICRLELSLDPKEPA